ncbi:UPF0187-domain-containing protein [Rickenella mellea]|uniref:UPF0187-domain-containing protein n=1 Tax=Rickenella mellea TaxID=50990 RepID=A0A4Y7PVB4_9AGAM|nr:UPF0187-domain-containing protein [Rickenella mellea]
MERGDKRHPKPVATTGHYVVDPFDQPTKFLPSLMKALLATALFRCWHILLFFAGWATMITVINHTGIHNLTFNNILLSVVGTVLGFVISYRTTASFERYNEGRRYWSQIVLASRTIARAVWFHIPELLPETPADAGRSEEERRARTIIEKKTVINLVEAFSVAVKHYLRGEDGVFYEDLFHLVKFLPSYAFPAGLPTGRPSSVTSPYHTTAAQHQPGEPARTRSGSNTATSSAPHLPIKDESEGASNGHLKLSLPHLPLPNTTKSPKRKAFMSPLSPRSQHSQGHRKNKMSVGGDDEELILLPARMPPKYHLFDLFPFSLLVKCLTQRGRELKGKKAARYRAKLMNQSASIVTHNVPLEISLYLTSYVAALTARKSIDVATTNLIINNINLLTDALTGLERILTTPVPFSYSIHLWVVTIIYCLALPFQIYTALKWLTIPGTVIASFVFFGFLVAGEEIENPFGYDKNDLNMDHFTHGIIRSELIAITSRSPPDPADWAFSEFNDRLFSAGYGEHESVGITPEQWVKRGVMEMNSVLANV